MNKYLVILDFCTCIAELHNVAVILAKDIDEAKTKFIQSQDKSDDTRLLLKVYKLTDIETDWYYFT